MFNNLIAIKDAYINSDSFGSDLPDNWEEIVSSVNDAIDNELQHYDYDGNEDANGEFVDRDDLDTLWEKACGNM